MTSVVCDAPRSPALGSGLATESEVTGDRSATDDLVLPSRMEDCGSPGAATSEVMTSAPPPPMCSASTNLDPSSEDLASTGASLTSLQGPKLLSPAGMEGNAVSSDHGDPAVDTGEAITTSESVSIPITVTSGKVRRRKSSPKKREMPDDIEFPLDIIVKEESSDDDYRAAIRAEASSDADGALSSGVWIPQNGTSAPHWGPQRSSRGRRKRRSPAFQKPLLIKSSADTASLMFVIPNEEMESVVDTKKRRKRKPEEYEEMHWCDTCDECFSEESALLEHMKSHLDQPQEDFDCEDCGRVFDSASELEQHRSKKHGKLRYCCDICGIQYNYKSQFVIHMRAHSGDKPFTCDECGQEFGHKCSLVIHQRKHTGVTPHQCKKCKKMLDTRVALAKHEKMRYCPDCETCYTNRSFAKHLVKNCVRP